MFIKHSKKIWPWIITAALVALFAVFTRLYQLGVVPAGLTWDEAALGYIGKMVLRTGHDEHGALLPITFTSFGDYKAPLAFYLTGLSTGLLGLSAWAVRLPFALAGIFAIASLGYLTWQLTHNKWLALLASWLVTILPWHFIFSRVAFESSLALLSFIWLLIAWFGWQESSKSSHQNKKYQSILTAAIRPIFWPSILILSTGFNLYVYHAGKIVLPLTWTYLLLQTWFSNRQFLQQKMKNLIWVLLGLVLVGTPLIFDSLTGNALERGDQTSFLLEQSFWLSAQQVLQNIGTHLSLSFLMQGSSTTLRHSPGRYGLLLNSQLVFFWLGIAFALGKFWKSIFLAIKKTPTRWSKLYQLFQLHSTFTPRWFPSWSWLIILLITLLPAAIGYEIPHANRALLAIVPLIILMIFGVRELSEELPEINFSLIFGLLLLFSSLEFSNFYKYYFSDYKIISSADWLSAQQPAMQQAQSLAKQGQKVKVTTFYGQPEIFYAFYNKLPMEVYRYARVPDVDFGAIQLEDFNHYDYIFSSPSEKMPVPVTNQINHLDGKPAFLIYAAP